MRGELDSLERSRAHLALRLVAEIPKPLYLLVVGFDRFAMRFSSIAEGFVRAK
jgi:hypothetical protein